MEGEYLRIVFKDNPGMPFYCHRKLSWRDLCQTIDEVFNENSWHQFLSQDVQINDRDVVLDCGAAEGLFSFVASTRARKVYAIEPIPDFGAGHRMTFSGNTRVEIMALALAQRQSHGRMTNAGICSRMSSDGSVSVVVETIDRLFGVKDEPVTFIKADIEGSEFPMLLGAEEVIKRNRPKLSIAVYHDQNNVYEIMDLLRRLHNDYQFRTRGVAANGNPVILHVF